MRKRRNYNLIFGLAITAFMAALIIGGMIYTPYDPDAMSRETMQAPSFVHLLGTDNLGRDIFSRILAGAGTTLIIAAATVAAGLIVGIVIGAFTGYFGGWVDEVLMRVNDVITAFPSLLLALVLISLLGSGGKFGKYNVIIALSLLFIPSFSRIVRSEVASQRELDYVRNAKLMGVPTLRIIFVHIMPNVVPVLLSSIAIGFNNAVLAEASMSYLSIGVQPPDASLGRMLSESQGMEKK